MSVRVTITSGPPRPPRRGRPIVLVTFDGTRFAAWLAEKTPSDIRLVQTSDPRDERTPNSCPRWAFFMLDPDGDVFREVSVYGLAYGPELVQ